MLEVPYSVIAEARIRVDAKHAATRTRTWREEMFSSADGVLGLSAQPQAHARRMTQASIDVSLSAQASCKKPKGPGKAPSKAKAKQKDNREKPLPEQYQKARTAKAGIYKKALRVARGSYVLLPHNKGIWARI